MPIDYRMAARFAEVYRRITLDIANAQNPPLWYENDLFGNLFASDTPKASRVDRH